MPQILTPVIPQNITVHLGPPSSAAQNVELPFIDYVKNVASSEIYPTWPEEALRANIYAIITFALNRTKNEIFDKDTDFLARQLELNSAASIASVMPNTYPTRPDFHVCPYNKKLTMLLLYEKR